MIGRFLYILLWEAGRRIEDRKKGEKMKIS